MRVLDEKIDTFPAGFVQFWVCIETDENGKFRAYTYELDDEYLPPKEVERNEIKLSLDDTLEGCKEKIKAFLSSEGWDDLPFLEA